MKIFGISDLHLEHKENREALERLPVYPNDWLIVAGDVGNLLQTVEQGFDILSPRFAKLFWVPGNHELWAFPKEESATESVEKYKNLIELCRKYKIVSPEDPFEVIQTEKGSFVLAPLFVLYDYSFRPEHISVDNAIQWANEAKLMCNDEYLLKPKPYPSIREWCEERVLISESKLDEAQKQNPEAKFILINHFPLRYVDATLWLIPRFSIWCGTKLTEKWPWKYPTEAVVYGHLHLRKSFREKGVRFEEVSLGYPKHWNQNKNASHYLRTILDCDVVQAAHSQH